MSETYGRSTGAPCSSLRFDRVGSAVVLTIDRPASGNALDRETVRALGEALVRVRSEPGLRGLVITGAGERVFCAGGDIKAYAAVTSPADLDGIVRPVRALFEDLEALPVPVIAAINGYALGGGAELALACDFRFSLRSALIGFPQSRLGIVPGWGGLERLTELCGRNVAMRLLFFGQPIDAGRALGYGIVDEIVEEGVVDAALRFIASLDPVAPLSIGAMKRLVLAAVRQPRSEVEGLLGEVLAELWFSVDHREAERAFGEKRRPAFIGR